MQKVYSNPTSILTSYFGVKASSPLDNRLVVNSISDLIDNSATGWDSYVYKGMVVSVLEDNNLYMYIGRSGIADDITNPDLWKLLAAGSVDVSLSEEGNLVINQGGVLIASIDTKDKVVNSGGSIIPTKKSDGESKPTGALDYKLDGEWIYKESSEYFIYWTPSITANANLTGALNSTDALTAEQVAAYNSKLEGAVKEGDTTPADYLTKVGSAAQGANLTTAEATAYNATLTGHKQVNDTLTAVEARTYNTTLPGAYSIKIVLSDLTGDLTDDILKKVYLKLNITNNLTPVIIPASTLVDIYTANNTHDVNGNLVNNDIQITISDDKKISATISNGSISSDKLSLSVQTSLASANSALQNVSIEAVNQSKTVDDLQTSGDVLNKLYYSNEDASATSDKVKVVIFNGNIADAYVSRQGVAANSEDTTKYYSYDGIATAANVKSYVDSQITTNVSTALTWDD